MGVGAVAGPFRAPGRCARAGVDDIDGLAADRRHEPVHVAPEVERILRGRRHANEFSAQRRQLVLQPPAGRSDQRAAALGDHRFGDLERRPLGAAGIEFGNNLENDHGSGKPGRT